MTSASQEPQGAQSTIDAAGASSEAAREALASGESLAGEGRRLEAIELLTKANRRERDPAIETRLVRLRNEAYEELDRSPRESPWPDDDPLPLNGSGSLPEISGEDLRPEVVREHILRYGCAYIPGLLSGDRVEQLIEGIDRAFEGHGQHFPRREDASPPDTAPWYVPLEPPDGQPINQTRAWVRQGGGVWTVESPRTMFDFLESLEEAGLRSLIQDYLGERPAMTLKKSTLRRTPVLPRADWHQDGAFLGEGIRTINLWLALSHCGDDAPGLDLVPRRLDRIVETGTAGAFFDWSVGQDTVKDTAEAAGVPILRPIFEPGDGLLFDELFLHRTATDESMSRERYAIENWFFAPSLYPGDQIPFVW
jgi:hypothetical protein